MYCVLVITRNATGPDTYDLADADLYPTRTEAEAAAQGMAGPLAVARWIGPTLPPDGGTGRPVAAWGYVSPFDQRKRVSARVPVLPLPEHGGGCRDEHKPLLDEAKSWIGSGLPLDALTREADVSGEEWEIRDDTPRMVSVTMGALTRPDGTRFWAADSSGQDNGEPWPAGLDLAAAIDMAEEHAADERDPPDDDTEDGDEGEPVYLALSEDGSILGAYDDDDRAEEAAEADRAESRSSYPWAWNWAYYLDDPRPEILADLQAAGFTIAKQTATDYYFAGIDGAGYDFASAHYAPFGAYRLATCGRKLPDGRIPVGTAREVQRP